MSEVIASGLGFPDYKKFTRTGEGGRLIEAPKLLDAPRIFSPVLLRVSVQLDPVRNGVSLMEAELPEVVRGYLGVSEDWVIDVVSASENVVLVACRADPSLAPGHKAISRVHNVTLVVDEVIDTSDDENEGRRAEISDALASDSSADAVLLSIPQNWMIPDPEFKPRGPTLPVYPNSMWLLFFKNAFGTVSGSSLIFKNASANALGMIALAIRFKEHRALRQCLLFLHRRYLIHAKEGMGMRLCFARPVNYDQVVAEAEGKSTSAKSSRAVAGRIPAAEEVLAESVGNASEVAAAFRQMLEKLEKLEAENQRLVEIVAASTGSRSVVEEPRARERSPRHSGIEMVVPAVGLPPWKNR
jgi:hypothetical protein